MRQTLVLITCIASLAIAGCGSYPEGRSEWVFTADGSPPSPAYEGTAVLTVIDGGYRLELTRAGNPSGIIDGDSHTTIIVYLTASGLGREPVTRAIDGMSIYETSLGGGPVAPDERRWSFVPGPGHDEELEGVLLYSAGVFGYSGHTFETALTGTLELDHGTGYAPPTGTIHLRGDGNIPTSSANTTVDVTFTAVWN